MLRSAHQLRGDALRVWRAGVAAVHPARLIPEFVHVEGGDLWIGDESIARAPVGKIAVIGGGKASGAMAAALEDVLGDEVIADKYAGGLVNVPENAVAP